MGDKKIWTYDNHDVQVLPPPSSALKITPDALKDRVVSSKDQNEGSGGLGWYLLPEIARKGRLK